MAAYHQMGHDSWNLITEKHLDSYAGIVLSPVNDSPDNVISRLEKLGKRRNGLEIVLDPQLYKPKSDRGHLESWPHFSSEVDTINLEDIRWWEERCTRLVETSKKIGATAICSPAMLPRVYDDEYYRSVVDCADRLHGIASASGLETLLTAVVRLPELAKKGAPQRISSILTSTRVDRVYLVFFDDLGPRDQRQDFEALAGGIKLIKLLEEAGTRVLVAFSGLDIVLWKAAGASDAATGKFFNLRRFVPGRWDDASEGGRVVPYWTDNILLTWLREDDVKLLDMSQLIDREGAAANPYSQAILDIIDAEQGEPWVALGWRQYMYWFMDTERSIEDNASLGHQLLLAADHRWAEINAEELFLFDRNNNGDWIRPWLNAVRIGLRST